MVVMTRESGGAELAHETSKKSNSEMSFVQALHNKYVDQEEINDQFIIPKDKCISTEITFVGFGTVSTVQKQLKRLTSIDLSNYNINSVGDTAGLQGALNRVTLLNLSDNKLTWQGIIDILTCLPNLKELIITSNDLHVQEFALNYPDQLYRKLKLLTLGRIDLRWEEIVNILSSIWIGVGQIDLWDNQICEHKMKLTSSGGFVSFLSQIQELRLSQNNFISIDWIVYTGCDNLRELDLSRCKLENFITDEKISRFLRLLEVLNISYNNISDWIYISGLNSLPSLKHLICNDNPFYITEKSAKALVVAKIGRLKLLNREEIARSMRRDSEILYLRKTFPEYKSYVQNKNDIFQKMHPRYQEIVDIYGLPEDLDEKKKVDKYVNVNLCYEGKQIAKKLPRDTRISNLKMLGKRLFRLKPSCKIEIVCSGQSTPSYPLDQDGQTLHFFSVKDDYNLLIKIE